MTGYDKKYLRIAMPAALESLFMILLASADRRKKKKKF